MLSITPTGLGKCYYRELQRREKNITLASQSNVDVGLIPWQSCCSLLKETASLHAGKGLLPLHLLSLHRGLRQWSFHGHSSPPAKCPPWALTPLTCKVATDMGGEGTGRTEHYKDCHIFYWFTATSVLFTFTCSSNLKIWRYCYTQVCLCMHECASTLEPQNESQYKFPHRFVL